MDAQHKLKDELERFLITVDLSYWPELQNAITDWLAIFQKYDYSKVFLDLPNMRSGGEPANKVEKHMIAAYSGEIEIRGNPTFDKYCALHIQLNELNVLTGRIGNNLITISSGEDCSSKK